MAIKTLKEFAAAARKSSGCGTISDMRAEIARLRTENLVLSLAIVRSDNKCDAVTLDPTQVAGMLMCSAVEVDAHEIEEETGMKVKATVAVDDDSFDVLVRLTMVGFTDDADPPCEAAEPEGVIARQREEIHLLGIAAEQRLPVEPCLPCEEVPESDAEQKVPEERATSSLDNLL